VVADDAKARPVPGAVDDVGDVRGVDVDVGRAEERRRGRELVVDRQFEMVGEQR
jgi:hypothetical protein